MTAFPTDDEVRAYAEEAFRWFQAYEAAGFSDAQAIAIVAALNAKPAPANVSPDMAEVMAKMSIIFDREIAE